MNTVFKYARITAAVAPAAASLLERGLNVDGLKAIIHKYSGYNIDSGAFEPHMLLQGYGPVLLTTAATYGIQKVSGMLRRL